MISSPFLAWNQATLRSQQTDGQQGWNRILYWNSLWVTLSSLTWETCLFLLAEGQHWEFNESSVAGLHWRFYIALPCQGWNSANMATLPNFLWQNTWPFAPSQCFFFFFNEIKSFISLLFLSTSLLLKAADRRKGELDFTRNFILGSGGTIVKLSCLGPWFLMAACTSRFPLWLQDAFTVLLYQRMKVRWVGCLES